MALISITMGKITTILVPRLKVTVSLEYRLLLLKLSKKQNSVLSSLYRAGKTVQITKC